MTPTAATLFAMAKPSRLPLVVGILLLISGWVVIILGWYQAGRQDLETGQLPYIISGGFGGFGLVVVGAVMILIDVVRQAETKLRQSAVDLHERMAELAEVFVERQRPQRPPRPVAQEPGDTPAKPRPRRRRRRRKPTGPGPERAS